MKMNRRQFLGTTLAGAGTVMLSGGALAAAQAATEATNPFQLVTLGKTGIKVSLIGMGTGMRGGNRQSNLTRQGPERAHKLLRYAYDKGIRYFDCADLYGTHTFVRDALKGIPRDSYVLCSKLWVRSGGVNPNDGLEPAKALDRFRKELGTDYVDFVQIHCMTDTNWTEKFKPQLDTMAELKSKGVIKAHGVTVHSLDAMQASVASPWVDLIHVRINAYGASMDKKNPAEVAPVVKALRAAGKGVVGMKLIGEGKFASEPSKIDDSLKFVLGLNAVDTFIVGFEETKQIDDFAARVQKALEAKQAAKA